ncbi:hypothetical protein J6590_106832, partial [Homalodisca vitripennis]
GITKGFTRCNMIREELQARTLLTCQGITKGFTRCNMIREELQAHTLLTCQASAETL